MCRDHACLFFQAIFLVFVLATILIRNGKQWHRKKKKRTSAGALPSLLFSSHRFAKDRREPRSGHTQAFLAGFCQGERALLDHRTAAPDILWLAQVDRRRGKHRCPPFIAIAAVVCVCVGTIIPVSASSLRHRCDPPQVRGNDLGRGLPSAEAQARGQRCAQAISAAVQHKQLRPRERRRGPQDTACQRHQLVIMLCANNSQPTNGFTI
eukprot:COSAG06_NODE_13179_length_1283_cov_0.855818_3_plen_209_part_00